MACTHTVKYRFHPYSQMWQIKIADQGWQDYAVGWISEAEVQSMIMREFGGGQSE